VPDAVIQAAGALLWRPLAPDTVELALVHRPERKDWTLPKGKLEPGEHPVTAAVREVHEETGYRVALGRPLPSLRYEVEGQPKRVRYWVARADETDRTLFVPGTEIDEVRWLPARQARTELTYPHDAHLLAAFDRLPVDTVPLVVIRHARAVKRPHWPGTVDAARPLEARGISQARGLIPLLAAYGIRRVHSSDATRCRDTVQPYARGAGLEVHDEPLLSEEGHAAGPAASRVRVADLLSEPEPLVLCTHRPVLADLLSVLLPTKHRKDLPPVPPLAPGALLVLHRWIAGSTVRVVAVERHRT
jgi:8-oxo-dGTP diphosphatase